MATMHMNALCAREAARAPAPGPHRTVSTPTGARRTLSAQRTLAVLRSHATWHAEAVQEEEAGAWPSWIPRLAKPEDKRLAAASVSASAASDTASNAPLTGFAQVKALGKAGMVAYVAVEMAFWGICGPLGAALANLSQDETAPSWLAPASAALLLAIRLCMPLKVGAAVMLAPAMQKLLTRGGEDTALLKAELRRAAGALNGTDRTAAQRRDLAALVERLAVANPTRNPARAEKLAGSRWKLLYSNSAAAGNDNAAGKLGPLVGRVSQEFSQSGLANVVQLGPLQVRVKAEYDVTSDVSLAVKFNSIAMKMGEVTLFDARLPAPKAREWQVLFSDEETRVLRVPDSGHVFVLERA